jgi:predicted DNA-binding transcriptional regulator AlpA
MPNLRKSKLAALKPALSVMTAATATISRAEFAAMLDKSQDTVDRMSRRNEGPVRFRVGREWRYRLIDIEAWLAQSVAEARHKRLASKPRRHAVESEINPNEAA